MNQEPLPISFERSAETRQIIHNLSELLEILYPDPPPDVLTLESFLYVYSWRVLNKSAIEKIEQSRRVNRVVGDYRQIGLNDFFLGLIYLYLGEWHAAARQFEKSQRTWSIKSGNEPASLSLANLAHGYAMESGYHYEEALSSYGKASHCLERIRYSTPSHQLDKFREKIEQYLTAAKFGLRKKMTSPPDTAESQERVTVVDAEAMDSARAQAAPGPVAFEDNSYNEHCLLYEVVNADTSSQPPNGSILVVNTDLQILDNHVYTHDDLLVIGKDQPVHQSSVHLVLRSKANLPQFKRICFLAKPEFVGPFVRNPATGEVKLIKIIPENAKTDPMPLFREEILGIVVGIRQKASL